MANPCWGRSQQTGHWTTPGTKSLFRPWDEYPGWRVLRHGYLFCLSGAVLSWTGLSLPQRQGLLCLIPVSGKALQNRSPAYGHDHGPVGLFHCPAKTPPETQWTRGKHSQSNQSTDRPKDRLWSGSFNYSKGSTSSNFISSAVNQRKLMLTTWMIYGSRSYACLVKMSAVSIWYVPAQPMGKLRTARYHRPYQFNLLPTRRIWCS